MATRRFLFYVVINSIALFFTFLVFRLIRVPVPDAPGETIPVFTVDDLVLWMIPVLGLIFTGISWVLRSAAADDLWPPGHSNVWNLSHFH